jgi:alanyl-tRNA synthetase
MTGGTTGGGRRWTGAALRTSFLKFFAARGHAVVPSSSLVPHDDPTLLFTNAGMNQFKEIFLGRRPVPYSPARAASVQKCLRAGGKHNDLENVGFTPRHHTFFEMLGNWSFGDYGKKQAIEWAWEYVTGAPKDRLEESCLGIAADRLYATVFREDDEAYDVWAKTIGLPPGRISRLGEDDNFWAMGETGPCGPCSEIHYDRGAEKGCGKPACGPGCDCGRFVEIWNLVFMELNRTESGGLVPLPMKNVDTGMGLERVLAILQGVESNFDTDLFAPIFDRIETDLAAHGKPKRRNDATYQASFRVIGDHLRALAFAVADGATPSNEGRGYVLRRILRRAVRHARLLEIEGPYLWTLVEPLADVMGDAYPEIQTANRGPVVVDVIRREEEMFGRTIDRGLGLFEKVAVEAAARADRTIPGESIFLLYDTYGFPVDLTAVMARERGLAIDEAGFERAMAAQRERSRAGADFKAEAEAEWVEVAGKPGVAGAFLRAEDPEVAASLAKGAFEASGARVLRYRAAPESVTGPGGEACWEIVLDKTPFYAEGGGQVGDSGWLGWGERDGAHRVRVIDTVATSVGNAHRVAIDHPGVLALSQNTLWANIDYDRRRSIMRNHTATHLLHAALRRVLGTHVAQAGSLVAPDRLRFDFQHMKKVAPEEMAEIERLVNEHVAGDEPVATDITTYDDARARGAMALFGEKYGDRVRMVSIGRDPAAPFSRELCGGTHCARTGEIERFLLVSESSVGSGVRRVEAVTGADAVRDLLEERARRERDEAARAAERERERERAKGAGARAGAGVDALLAAAARVGDARVVAARVPSGSIEELKAVGDALREKASTLVAVLAGEWDDRVGFVVVVTDDLASRGVHAGKVVGEVAAVTGGKGGGKPTFAQAGGRDPAKVDEALARVGEIVRSALGVRSA